ncbi:MAG: Gfo/Idh/MocA family oxidoreductase [Rhodospirillaceae bacterium]|nr:MAG: Gfo/Idh/MocA family oxidoreductase [Rhodospirillaceae bacterium]
MAPAPLKIAIIGLGVMGMRHARCVASHPDATLAVLVDVDRARRDAAVTEFGAACAETIGEIRGQADAAIVAVPTAAHAAIATSLLGQGIPCLVEKPFVASPAEGVRVAVAAKASGAALQIGHIERFNPAIMALFDRISDPSAVRAMTARRISGASARVTDIDVVMDLMVHDIDVMLALKRQPVVHVDAKGDANHAEASITFADASVADLTASRIHPVRIRDLRVFLDNIGLEVDYIARSLTEIRTGDGGNAVTTSQPVHTGDALVSQLDAFIAATRGDNIIVPATDALAVMDVAWRVQAALGLPTP